MNKQDSSRLLHQYNELFKEMDETYHILAKHYGLSDSAFWILYMLRETDTTYTQSEICDLLSLSKQTINSALKNMEADGYLVLAQNDDNRRNKKILLTDAGRKLAEQTIDRVVELDRNALGRFTEEEANVYLSLFERHLRQIREEAEKILTTTTQDS